MRDGRKVGTWPVAEVDQRRIANLMTGVDIEHGVVARDMSAAEPLLVVERLSRRGEFADVSLTLRTRRGPRPRRAARLGADRVRADPLRHEPGRGRADHASTARCSSLDSNRDAVHAGIAYVSEDRLSLGVVLPQSIEDNLVLAVMKRLTGRFGLMSGEARRALAAEWVRRLAVKVPGLDRPVQTLSGGNQQRVVLAKWLATDPKVLILDSPTVGVDIKNKQGIYDVVAELARERRRDHR